MRNIFLLVAMLTMAACGGTTPLPEVRGSTVRPLNPTKWDYEDAVARKQREIGLHPQMGEEADA
ncbi:hypothetical protein LAZ40_03485 [Cereibacter sphaeroides]|uniref:hypothetical protein n=1 Tax=Cereibacter sphaeroides TaxID=1063 RepID=UPI001F457318|nr:hypothetical protein [Cereibacter sphaeroides]MCE6958118.1 hypothetical protein [Cereibacter sphaeroides]MCE6971645.1 hypothetical protein [Cereibacter sphaeroides]